MWRIKASFDESTLLRRCVHIAITSGYTATAIFVSRLNYVTSDSNGNELSFFIEFYKLGYTLQNIIVVYLSNDKRLRIYYYAGVL